MLSLLLTFVLAGVPYVAGQGAFSDCAAQEEIIGNCSNQHLQYLSADKAAAMQQVAQIDDALYLVRDVGLHFICNDADHLREYYECVFTDLATCLKNANSSEVNNLADADTISEGIGNLCESRHDVNTSCVVDKSSKVEECATTGIQTADQACRTYEILVDCMDKMELCEGGGAVKAFVTSTLPHACSVSSDAKPLTSLGLLAVTSLSAWSFSS